jgi:diguanylate cyclase (GGDEF)-like protein
MSFLGLIAWVSVCLIVAGFGPPLGPMFAKLWACTGLLGLASAVGLAVRVKREMRRQRELLKCYMAEATTDPLTGLANRRALDRELDRRLAQFRRQQVTVSVLLIDVDCFKRFNDTFGHPAGDEMLRGISRVLANTLRGMDLVTRYGGEEFVAVLPGTNLAQAQLAAERVRKAVEQNTVFFRDRELRTTVCVGVAEAVQLDDAGTLVRRADDALYGAKRAGRNRSYFHDGSACQPVCLAPATPAPGSPAC